MSDAELAQVRSQRQTTKSRLSRLSAEQQRELKDAKRRAQLHTVLLPDAPPRKRRPARPSPERYQCVFLPELPLPVLPLPMPESVPGCSWMVKVKEEQAMEIEQEIEAEQGEIFNLNDGVLWDKAGQPVQFNLQQLEQQTAADADAANAGGDTAHKSFHSISVLDKEFSDRLGDPLQDSDIDSDNDKDLNVDVCESVPINVTASDQPADDTGISLATAVMLRQEEEASDQLLRDLAPPHYYDFNWTANRDDFTATREVFTGSPGPTFPVTNETRPVDIFYKMFDQTFTDLLVTETNRYADQTLTRLRRDPAHKKASRVHCWTPTDRDEMLTFLAFIILQGLYPKVSEESYFSYDGFGTTPNFRRVLSYNRYHLLKTFQHFVDNRNLDQTKLDRIRPVIDYFNDKFGSLYMPNRDIVIDESLLKFNGQLSFAQKILTKAARVGVKTYELCESSSGYLWKFAVYTGKDGPARKRTNRGGANQQPDDGQEDRQEDSEEQDRPAGHDNQDNYRLDDRRRGSSSIDHRSESPEVPDNEERRHESPEVPDNAVLDTGSGNVRPSNATAKIVYELVEPLLHKGHTLIMDNFYNSPLLARCLKRDGQTDVFGTLRLSREFVPEAIKEITKADMRHGEVAVSYTSDLAVMLWRDANLVSMISTFHPLQIGRVNKYNRQTYKPAIVLDYNKSMGGVDRKDQFLSAQPLERQKTKRWYKKLFRRLYNVAVFNCFVIFKTRNPTVTHRQFRVRLAEDLIRIHRHVDLATNPRIRTMRTGTNTKTVAVSSPRLNRPYVEGNHFPVRASSNRVRCKMCTLNKISTRTAYMCEECGVNLCVLSCFKDYHKLGPRN